MMCADSKRKDNNYPMYMLSPDPYMSRLPPPAYIIHTPKYPITVYVPKSIMTVRYHQCPLHTESLIIKFWAT